MAPLSLQWCVVAIPLLMASSRDSRCSQLMFMTWRRKSEVVSLTSVKTFQKLNGGALNQFKLSANLVRVPSIRRRSSRYVHREIASSTDKSSKRRIHLGWSAKPQPACTTQPREKNEAQCAQLDHYGLTGRRCSCYGADNCWK